MNTVGTCSCATVTLLSREGFWLLAPQQPKYCSRACYRTSHTSTSPPSEAGISPLIVCYAGCTLGRVLSQAITLAAAAASSCNPASFSSSVSEAYRLYTSRVLYMILRLTGATDSLLASRTMCRYSARLIQWQISVRMDRHDHGKLGADLRSDASSLAKASREAAPLQVQSMTHTAV